MMIKLLYLFLGTVSLGLGIAGIVLPVLPTTPLLLLAAWLYYRSSPHLYDKLMNHKYLGVYIKSFREDKSIPLSIKIYSISLLWVTILLSAFCAVDKIWLRILLLLIAVGVTIHILSYKTRTQNKKENKID